MDLDTLMIGDWIKIDGENKVTEISFSLKDKFIAKMTFDLMNDTVAIDGDLSKVTDLADNDEFIETYKECSKEILRII